MVSNGQTADPLARGGEDCIAQGRREAQSHARTNHSTVEMMRDADCTSIAQSARRVTDVIAIPSVTSGLPVVTHLSCRRAILRSSINEDSVSLQVITYRFATIFSSTGFCCAPRFRSVATTVTDVTGRRSNGQNLVIR